MTDTETFETWAIIELFGHRQLAGKVSEQQVAGATMLRIDVPAHEERPAFTRMYGSGALYGITPCTEADVHAFLGYYRVDRLPVYLPKTVLAEPVGALASGDGDDWEPEF